MNSSDAELLLNDEPSAAEVERIVCLLPRLAQRLHAALAERAQAAGLTPAQAKVLLQVGLGGPMPVGEIASTLGISMPATSEIVDRLVEAGYVRREDDPADRRRVIVAPSASTRAFARNMNEERSAQVRQALTALPRDRHSAFAIGLAALVEALGGDGGCARAIAAANKSTTRPAPREPVGSSGRDDGNEER